MLLDVSGRLTSYFTHAGALTITSHEPTLRRQCALPCVPTHTPERSGAERVRFTKLVEGATLPAQNGCMTVTKHAESFGEHLPAQTEVSTLDELLAVEWIAKWKRRADFHQFSVSTLMHSESDRKVSLLMAERNGGAEWQVAPILHGDGRPAIGLPEWKKRNY